MNKTVKHVQIANALDKLEKMVLDMRMQDGSPIRLVVMQNELLNLRSIVYDLWRDDFKAVEPKQTPYYPNHR